MPLAGGWKPKHDARGRFAATGVSPHGKISMGPPAGRKKTAAKSGPGAPSVDDLDAAVEAAADDRRLVDEWSRASYHAGMGGFGGRGRGGPVPLSEIRAGVYGISRDRQNAALARLARTPGVHIEGRGENRTINVDPGVLDDLETKANDAFWRRSAALGKLRKASALTDGPAPVVPGAAPKAPRKAAAKVAAKKAGKAATTKAAAEAPETTAAKIQAAASEDEAKALLQGLTVARLKAVAPHVGVHQTSGRKADLIDKIAYSGVGSRLDSEVFRTMKYTQSSLSARKTAKKSVAPKGA